MSGELSRPAADPKSSTSTNEVDSGKESVPIRETWSLRRQLIVPLGATILVVAAAISAIAWWAAQDAQQRWAEEKMDTVYEQLRQASYPLTGRVIEQIKNYSGVDAIVVPRDGVAITTLAATDLQSLERSGLRSSRPRGKFKIEDRLFLYRRYAHPEEGRDDELKELILLVHPLRNSELAYAPVWAPIASGLVSVLAMILVITAVGSRIVRRIENLESQVVQIAQGNFDLVEPKGPDDAIRRLSVSINSMSSRLAKAQDWVARTERSRLISMIAGGMAHQLRNALTGASLLVQSFIRSHPGKPVEELVMAENQLKLAAESVRRLLASDPNVELVDEPEMNAGAITDAARDCVATYAQHQQVSMVWDIESDSGAHPIPQGAAVVGGIVNLLMNAIEAAGRGGEVRCEQRLLSADRSRGSSSPRVRWRIQDNGPGPDPALEHSIMEPFVTSKKEGIGLGLAMAARIANRCDGSLSWRRANPYTIFELIIPSVDRTSTQS
jgi:signal transduction histidine kinase